MVHPGEEYKGVSRAMRRMIPRNRAFTAVEIAMVASVIAIIALLILPIFRKRAEEARLVAAQDELQSIVKALLLVEADMPGGNYFPPLNDLDNRENTEAAVNDIPDLQPSRLAWGFIVAENQFGFSVINEDVWRTTVVPNWRGPYIAVRKAVSLAQIQTQFPEMTRNFGQGPIFIPAAPWDAASLAADRYPIDPWGRPYLLFGQEETIYNIRAVYSLGPNGIPGPPDNNPTRPTQASDYNRRFGILGLGDDLEFLF